MDNKYPTKTIETTSIEVLGEAVDLMKISKEDVLILRCKREMEVKEFNRLHRQLKIVSDNVGIKSLLLPSEFDIFIGAKV